MATYANCLVEKARLMRAPKRCQVKICRYPLRADDGSPIPTVAGDDYLIAVKDPRGSSTSGGADSDSQASFRASAAIVTDNRQPNGSSEPELDIRGHIRGCEQGTPTHPGWLLYDVGTTREGGDIPDSEVVFA